MRNRIIQTVTRHFSIATARRLGYVPVTYGYRPATEGALLENALVLMRDSGADHVVVNNETTKHPEIWRHWTEVKGIKEADDRRKGN